MYILSLILMLSPLSLHSMERSSSLEDAKQNLIEGICHQHQDAFAALNAIEKEVPLTLPMLAQCLYVPQFSHHIRTLLYKMLIITLNCPLQELEITLSNSMFCRLSPLMKKFILERYAATYYWTETSSELGEKELLFLQSRKKRIQQTQNMRVFILPEHVEITVRNREPVKIPYSVEDDTINAHISKSSNFAIVVLMRKRIPELLAFAIPTQLMTMWGCIKEAYCVSSSGRCLNLKTMFLLQETTLVRIASAATITPGSRFSFIDVKGQLGVQFSNADEFLCITFGPVLYLVDLRGETISEISPPINIIGKKFFNPVFSVDATVLCVLNKNSIHPDIVNCLVIDTFSKKVLQLLQLPQPFFTTIYIMPNNHSLIVRAGAIYKLYNKNPQSGSILKNRCTYLLSDDLRKLLSKVKKKHSKKIVSKEVAIQDMVARRALSHLITLATHTLNAVGACGTQESLLKDNGIETDAPSPVFCLQTDERKNGDNNCKTYLALDASGNHAIVVTHILNQIEDYLDDSIVKYFDVITGSEFGAIVGLGLVASHDGFQPLVSSQNIYEFFSSSSVKIFDSSSRFEKKPFYDNKNLQRSLRSLLQQTRLSDALTQFVLPIQKKSNNRDRAPVILPYTYDRNQAQKNELEDIRLAQLALYAAADNKFFPLVNARHCTVPHACSIGASKAYQRNSARYILENLLMTRPPIHEKALVLSISPHLVTEESLRTHNHLRQHLGNQNYMHLQANRIDILQEPDKGSSELFDSYREISQNVCKNAEAFLRKLQEIKASKHALAQLEA